MMDELADVLIGGEWRESTDRLSTFRAIAPTTGCPIVVQYPVSPPHEVEASIVAGVAAAEALADAAPERMATFLDGFADGIEAARESLVEIAHIETGLPKTPRLADMELPRTVNQLRQGARVAREQSWRQPVVDRAANLAAWRAPLGGPVVVFGPNNFPFAFNSVSGGDAVAAWVAGNPVIAKGHPNHPGTTRLLAQIGHAAAREAGLPDATLQLLYHIPNEVGLALVGDARVGASAFTGSRAAGLALKAAADKAGRPFYAEMSSINPVFLLAGALDERGEAIAEELFASCTAGSGQFCTNPGLVVLAAGDATERFIATATARYAASAPGLLLAQGVFEGLGQGIAALEAAGAERLAGGDAPKGDGFRWPATLLRVSGERFLADPEVLQQEVFGSTTLLVVAQDDAEMQRVARALAGQLTATIYSATGDADAERYAALEPLLRRKVGRLLNDRMPTGVAVSPAMNHGGPFPATGHPGFTAVGLPASVARFTALHSYDHVRPERLPAMLRAMMG